MRVMTVRVLVILVSIDPTLDPSSLACTSVHLVAVP